MAGIDAMAAGINNGMSVGLNLGILACITVGMEVLKYVALQIAFRFNLL